MCISGSDHHNEYHFERAKEALKTGVIDDTFLKAFLNWSKKSKTQIFTPGNNEEHGVGTRNNKLLHNAVRFSPQDTTKTASKTEMEVTIQT